MIPQNMTFTKGSKFILQCIPCCQRDDKILEFGCKIIGTLKTHLLLNNNY